jgi:antitoxin HicB
MFNYPVTLTKDGDTILVRFRDIPKAITFGADKEEALLNAVDALETGLSFYVEARKALPLPSKVKRFGYSPNAPNVPDRKACSD